MLPDDDAFGLVRSSSVFIAVWQHFLPVGRRSRSRRLIIAASTERRPPLTSRVIVNTSQYTFSVFTAAPCVLRHVRVKLMSNQISARQNYWLASSGSLLGAKHFKVSLNFIIQFPQSERNTSLFFPKNGRTATLKRTPGKCAQTTAERRFLCSGSFLLSLCMRLMQGCKKMYSAHVKTFLPTAVSI